ncbi:hypothetical protein GCM10010978_22840 [Compostibacillus humi]|uniref:AAA domain-containing protein n=1 Tax=Compostibacillus humi TaxID=1245525 RepID=A0A8J2TNT2_9BACI|nr:AAA family ATPase [Compostibacillus humi]GFZ81240.1 hypothetical protein GCM10010978_22840 [Compostibacillus humi]
MPLTNDVYIIGKNEELVSLVKEQIGNYFTAHEIAIEEIRKYEPNLIVLVNAEGNTAVEYAQLILSELHETAIICVNDEENFDVLRGLNRLGITDYYILPGEEILFMEKLHTLAREAGQRKLQDQALMKRGGGKVFSFYSGSGGTGKSIVSSVFAQTLKLESTANVLFIDLNLQYGGAETYLNLDSSRSIVDLLPVIDELNEQHIRNVAEMEEHSNMHVIVSPRDAEMAERVSEELILRLLRAAKRSYDFIIIDLPVWMDERTYIALEESTKIYYVMNLDTQAIKIFHHVEKLFQRLGIVMEERMDMVLNFKGKDKELTKKDLERFVTYPIAVEIRRDKNLQNFINKGVPLRKTPKEKKMTSFAKDVHKWVNSMLK